MEEEVEIWKPIKGYEDYEVSNLGRVVSLKYGKRKLLKFGLDSSGYNNLCLSSDGVVITKKPYKLVAIAFLNHKPDGTARLVVDHINGIKTDDRLNNLQIITSRENVIKSIKNPTSKYTGVHWKTSRSKWIASIFLNGKTIYLGAFKCELVAHQTYLKALPR